MRSANSRTSPSTNVPIGGSDRPGVANALSVLVGGLIWEGGVRAFDIRPIFLPAPSRIAAVVVASWRTLLFHSLTTGSEIALGFFLGAAAGCALALAFHGIKAMRAALEPYVVLSQLVPKAALAPLFILWLGFGLKPKVVVTAVICFYPRSGR